MRRYDLKPEILKNRDQYGRNTKGEITLLLKQNEVYLTNAYKSLKTLLNTSEEITVPANKNYYPLKADDVLDSLSIAKHPTVKAFYQEMEIAEKNKKVEKSQGLPEFTIGYTNQSLIGFQTINGMEQYFNGGSLASFRNSRSFYSADFRGNKSENAILGISEANG